MTTYGTISHEPAEEASNQLVASRAKQHIQTGLDTRRPWKEMIQPSHFRFPANFLDSIHRIKTNAATFRANYVIIILLVLFLSLLWHPISMIIFVAMMVAWLFFYFLRDNPLVVSGYVIDERVVAMCLLVVTVGVLFLANVTHIVIAGISVGVGIVFLHAVMRETQDLFPGDEEGGIIRAGREVKVRLKQAASSSFTMS